MDEYHVQLKLRGIHPKKAEGEWEAVYEDKGHRVSFDVSNNYLVGQVPRWVRLEVSDK